MYGMSVDLSAASQQEGAHAIFLFFESFLRKSFKMQQKWPILTEIDDQILRIYSAFPSMHMV